MNKIIKRTFISVICLLIGLISLTAFTLTGCYSPSGSQGSGNNQQPNEKASVSYSISEKIMIVGDEEYLIPDYKKLSGYTLTYSSNNAQVASVTSQGKVSAQGEGSAVITATYSNGSDSASFFCVNLSSSPLVESTASAVQPNPVVSEKTALPFNPIF